METKDENQDIVIISNDVEMLEADKRAEFDIQISTAKRFPRDLTRVKNNAVAIVTMSKETAETCRYVLPRGTKNLSGPSVHLARILAQQYGNLRVNASVKQITDKQVVSESIAWDLETNYASKIEVRRSIMQNEYVFDPKTNKSVKTGRMLRMNDDMITVTGNAANAIAFRNAVLNIIPKSIIDVAYNASIECITGDLSDETKLIKVRDAAIKWWKETHGVSELQILESLKLKVVTQIKAQQIADLRGFAQSIKDGDATVNSIFNAPKKDERSGDEKKADLKSKGTTSTTELP